MSLSRSCIVMRSRLRKFCSLSQRECSLSVPANERMLSFICRASAIRTEEEIRRMRDNALFRAKVTFPFSSETSTLVDSPGAQVNIARPSTPKVVEKSEDKRKDAHE